MPLILDPAATPPDLRGRLADLRRRMRIVTAGRGVARLAALALGVVTAVAVLDRGLHLPALVRALALVGLVAGGALAVGRWLRRPWRELRDELSLALRVEDHFPAFNDALASAVQFAHGTADGPGSPVLRRATQGHATRAAEDCDFRELVDGRGFLVAALLLLAATVVATPLAALYPAAARTALVRFADPFGDHSWPPQTAFALDAPAWIARGEPFELHCRLDGVIPERASFAFALDGVTPSETPVSIVPGGDTTGNVRVVLDAPRVPRNFRYQLRANDADTGWKHVEVLSPPQLVPFDGRSSPRLHLDFPAYTDLPAMDLPDGGGTVEAVAGTRVRLRAATDRPVAHAWVEFVPESPRLTAAAALGPLAATGPAAALGITAAEQQVWGRIPATLDAAGQRFEVAFVPPVSGPYLLRFEDASGLGGKRPLDLRMSPDPAPVVTLERPSAGQDSLALLPDATFTLQARVEDPVFAVRSVWLEYRTARDEAPRRLPLYDHAVHGAAVSGLLTPVPTLSARLRPPMVQVEDRLSLKRFRHADGRPLREGDVLTLQVAADDFDDYFWGKPPGRSHEVELRVIGPAALDAAVQKSTADVQRELQELHRLQRDALDRATTADKRRRETGQLRPEDQEKLLQAEQMQQQLRGRLGNEQEGLRAEVARLRQALRDNPLPPSPAGERLDALAAELDRLAREEVEPVEPLLTAARKEAEAAKPVPPEQRKQGALPQAVEHQRESERTLRDLLERLEPWSEARELRGEAGAVLREQERLNKQREQMQGQVERGKRPEELPPSQQEDLKRLQERQEALSGRASDLSEKLSDRAVKKEQAVRDKQAEAEAKEKQAGEREAQAADPAVKGTPREAPAKAEAKALRQQAAEAREAAAALGREAQALKQAQEAVAGAAPPEKAGEPPPSGGPVSEQMKQAAAEIGRNQLGEAQRKQEAAARALEKARDALREQPQDDADRLLKRQREAQREIEELAQEQEKLQKELQDARQIADPQQRQQKVDELTRKQEQLRDRTRELAQRLTRLKGDEAARELRRASRAMERAGQQMEQGEPADQTQDDALDRLDDAKEELQKTADDTEDRLQRERLAKLADQVKGLKERQEALSAEGERVFDEVAKGKRWERPLRASAKQLAGAERDLGGETAAQVEKRFKDLKVFGKLVQDAADAMAEAAAALDAVVDQADPEAGDPEALADDRQSVRKQQQLALKRLEQVLDALKDDPQERQARKEQQGEGQPPMGGEGGSGGGESDGVPPLAQLKLLRALQAEVNERTEAFAKEHADPTKLTEPEQAELEAVRALQASVAELLEELTPAAPDPAAGPAIPPEAKKGDKP